MSWGEQLSLGDARADVADDEMRTRAESQAGEATESSGAGRLLYLTNDRNLRLILGSRLLTPRIDGQKRYADLLDRFPGWVPLLTSLPGPSLISAVTAERGSGSPVLIEFREDSLAHVGRPRGDAYLLTAAALSSAVAIHFPSSQTLQEFAARSEANVHAVDHLLNASPELFESAIELDLMGADHEPPALEWEKVDRIRGAVSACIRAASTGEKLAVAAAALGARLSIDYPVVSEWTLWELVSPNDEGRDRSSNGSAMCEIASLLIDRDAGAEWRPEELLRELAASEVTFAGSGDLNAVARILAAEVDFSGVDSSGIESDAMRSLVMVLLRHRLIDQLDWLDTESRATERVAVGAAILAGLLRGLRREDAALRDAALDDLTAEWAVRHARDSSASLGEVEFEVTEGGCVLRIDQIEVGSSPPMLRDPAGLVSELSGPSAALVKVELGRLLGASVTTTVVIEGEIEESVQSPGGRTFTTTGRVSVSEAVDEDVLLAAVSDTEGHRRRKTVEWLSKRVSAGRPARAARARRNEP